MSLRVWHKLNLVYEIRTRLCKLESVYKALFLVIISLKTHRINDGKLFQPKLSFKWTISLLLGRKKLSIFLRACTQAHNFCRHFRSVQWWPVNQCLEIYLSIQNTDIWQPNRIQNWNPKRYSVQKKSEKYIKLTWSRVSTTWSVLCHSTNEIIPRDTCATLQTRIICDNQKRSGLANKITKMLEIWIKRSVRQFLKSKSTFRNNIYRTVAFSQVF